MPAETRTRAIWLGLAGLLLGLVLANLALLPRARSAPADFVPACTACHDGLLIALPRH